MKNKEIEVLLNELKDKDNYIEEYGFRYKRIALDDWWLLLSYIEQLRKKIDQYENPDDLTLFYMWLDEKAKDKMKQLETNYKEANESVIWWQNRYNAIVKQNDDNHKKVVKLENNRDKAIEYIEEDINECKYENRIDRGYLINILKGDSDE